MSAACHACGFEAILSTSDRHCCICGQAICLKCGRKVYSGQKEDWWCNGCFETHEKQFTRIENLNFSPTCFISSAAASAESDDNLSMDGKHLEQNFSNLSREIIVDRVDSKTLGGSLSSHSSMEDSSTSSLMTSGSYQYASHENAVSSITQPVDEVSDSSISKGFNGTSSLPLTISDDAQPIRPAERPNETETAEISDPLFLDSIGPESSLWMPPDPEDAEDDNELSVANIDDDDDYNDGTQWTVSSSFDIHDDGISLNYKKQRQKAIMDAIDGQFKLLVGRFLVSEGIAFPEGGDYDNWLDIVADLSLSAAVLIKPDAREGKAMDPASYVKIKCIASGSPGESKVIKGLVFKKNTAHKHMPTNFKNPRLLLLRGILGERAIGLSSFDSMQQEQGGYLKSINEMIDMCNPNVVLVEKTVSRDVQEFLLKKGITLVFDMKLPRLEKLARCTGSEIYSSADFPMNIKLRQCGSFHIDKVVEEHNSSEGGKKPSKTLMYFDGCTRPLGCTVLLKGAHSDELKKIKRVMHFTIFAAHHLILETSFFADQKAISLMPNENADEQIFLKNKLVTSSKDMIPLHPDDVSFQISSNGLPAGIDVLNSSGSQEYFYLDGIHRNHITENGRVSAALLSDFHSDSGSNFVGSDFVQSQAHLNNTDSHEVPQSENFYDSSISSLLPGQLLSFPSSREVVADRPYYLYDDTMLSYLIPKEIEPGSQYIQASNDFPSTEVDVKVKSTDVLIEGTEDQTTHVADEPYSSKPNGAQMKDDVEAMLDSHSILVLFSSRCISKEIVCEESHLSRIKYYGNFDMCLGQFLKNILLNERHKCARCAEPPEAHIYSYTHQNGKLTVQVKKLPAQSRLSGEAEGKIWMWTTCLKCQYEGGTPRSTRRVVMSSEARGLSFGKFLELSFSSHSAARKLSRCGHLLHRDCLRFFGFGSKVAVFKYSPVVIFTACKPPPVLEFNSSMPKLEWLDGEVKDVQAKAERFFVEVEKILKELKPKFVGQRVRFKGLMREFSEVENIMQLEKADFEASLLNATGYFGQPMAKTVNTAYLYEELLLGLYVWDRRIHLLLSFEKDTTAVENNGRNIQELGSQEDDEQFRLTKSNSSENCEEQNHGQNSKEFLDRPSRTATHDVEESCASHAHTKNLTIVDARQEAPSDFSESPSCETQFCLDVDVMDIPITESSNDENTTGSFPENGSAIDDRDIPIDDGGIPISSGHMENRPSSDEFDAKTEDTHCNVEKADGSLGVGQDADDYESTVKLREVGDEWIWNPFPDIYKALLKDSFINYSDKFGCIRCYKFEHMSSLTHMIAHERERMAYPVGTEGVIISVHEEEVSSIIACALTLLYDRYIILDSPPEKDKTEGNVVTESMQRLLSDGFMSSFFSSSNGSIERILSYQSLPSSFDELSTSSSEGSSHTDRLLSSEKLHPEIVLENIDKKNKYSVVCIHAKLFHDLRRRCCPSELAYVSSLSRCKKWDAQGGKSKALFAKTLDDRFIIKEIKKTELESFLKFAPEYFNHVSLSLESGSQTCLAKILGIYQVRQIKNGKEIKSDLMVMENLLYGHSVSRTYDLKGAVYARYISDPSNPEKVLLDQNFVEDMGLSPMYIGGRTKQLLTRAIWNDTSFLTSINVMDYSLLLGVDKQRRELVFGIIDYLRQYTWDKQLETWVKSSLVVPRNSLPTVISPREYKKRFRKFMSKYFLTVPDSWTDSSPDPSKPGLDDGCSRTNSEESLHKPNCRSDSEGESLHKPNQSSPVDPPVTGD